jgi:hypothetical protein
VIDEHDGGWAVDGRHVAKDNGLKVIYHYTRWCWVLLALASLVLQATRTVDIGELHETILDKGELAITSLFDIEIIIRILAELPNWRSFFVHGNNLLDLILAIGSTIIQIPAIHQSEVYPWLTIFQLARFYRVILEVPRMKPLMVCLPLTVPQLCPLMNLPVLACGVRKHVWLGKHVALPSFGQLHRGSGGCTIPAWRPSVKRNYELWPALQLFSCYLSGVLVRKLAERALCSHSGRNTPWPSSPHCHFHILVVIVRQL